MKEVDKFYTCSMRGKWKRDPNRYNLKVNRLTSISEETDRLLIEYANKHNYSVSKAIRTMILEVLENDKSRDI